MQQIHVSSAMPKMIGRTIATVLIPFLCDWSDAAEPEYHDNGLSMTFLSTNFAYVLKEGIHPVHCECVGELWKTFLMKQWCYLKIILTSLLDETQPITDLGSTSLIPPKTGNRRLRDPITTLMIDATPATFGCQRDFKTSIVDFSPSTL